MIGIVIGAIPLKLPGMNVAMQIGLAGGPMLVAIALSRLGNIGSVVWYMPPAANQILLCRTSNPLAAAVAYALRIPVSEGRAGSAFGFENSSAVCAIRRSIALA